MLVKCYGSAVSGIDARTITVEVDVSSGAKYYIVGLPDNTVKESLQRVESAIKSSGFTMPRIKIVINLAPADIRKNGSAFDLPIAIGILGASNQIQHIDKLAKYMLMGELSLDGEIKKIHGTLPITIQAQREHFEGLILPNYNVEEGSIVQNLNVFGAHSLKDVVDFIEGKKILEKHIFEINDLFENVYPEDVDFSEVKGQQNIKRALEIAAAGGHNAILIGPPGAGKTMLAKRIPSILPPLIFEESLETTKIYSVAGKILDFEGLITQRPFRSPHHTISDVALVGGGSNPLPGEISLSHHGVLFLDELPEFKRTVLEVLRQPMEERKITISRARQSIDFPANFMLVASMNPCPCGFYNHPEKQCSCTSQMVQKYLNKISGPLLDRIDLHVEVTPVPIKDFTMSNTTIVSESSKTIRTRVILARKKQSKRFDSSSGIYTNAQMSSKMIKEICVLNNTSQNLLKTAMTKLQLSARAYDRILKVSRTIADLENSDSIEVHHIAEAIQYRSLDRESWGLAN
ncbi:MAG: YifB family Mg chelatase-like AAA ATPase [Chitinophagaceae bacterium]